MTTTSDVLDNHLKCFGENDLDGVLADYSSDVVLFMPDKPLKGLAAIKPSFRRSFRSLQSLAHRLRCGSDTLTEITLTSYGMQKQQTIRTSLPPTHLLCGTGR